METDLQKGAQPLTYEAWSELLSRHAAPDLDLPLRRKHQRLPVRMGIVKLSRVGETKPLVHTISLLDVSTEGLTVKTEAVVPVRAWVRVEGAVMYDRFVLIGQVVHSTLSVGGYKTGIQLQFDGGEQPRQQSL